VEINDEDIYNFNKCWEISTWDLRRQIKLNLQRIFKYIK